MAARIELQAIVSGVERACDSLARERGVDMRLELAIPSVAIADPDAVTARLTAICKRVLASAMDGATVRVHVKGISPAGQLDVAVTMLVPMEASADRSLDELLDGEVQSPPACPLPRREGSTRVLLVDDSTTVQLIVQSMLEHLGCIVDVAANGVQGIAMWRSHRYDLILMDCEMPDVDGFEATRMIRELEPINERTPIIALTSHAEASSREACVLAGMDGHLAKPATLEALEATLAIWSHAAARVA